jgi:hypothetical protein
MLQEKVRGPEISYVADRRSENICIEAVIVAELKQIRDAGILIGKHRFELSDAHLMNWLRAAGHGSTSFVVGYNGAFGRGAPHHPISCSASI